MTPASAAAVWLVACAAAVAAALLVLCVLFYRAQRQQRLLLAGVREELARDLELKQEIAKGLGDLARGLARQGSGFEALGEGGWTWSEPRYSLEQIAGLPAEVEEQVRELTSMVKQRQRFTALGARLPGGVLLSGPPGVGKTLLAHALARECGYSRICVVSAAMLLGPLFGLSTMRLRRLFEEARTKRPCAVLFDEIEVVGGARRQTRLSGADTELHNLVNQLLQELESFEAEDVLVLATTNRPEMIEPALLRKGRLERQIHLDLPDAASREAILRLHARGKPLTSGVHLGKLATGAGAFTGTSGFSGADLEEVLNEAAIHAGVRGASAVGKPDVEKAVRRLRQLLRTRSANERDEGFGRTLAQFYDDTHRRVRFDDVGGQQRAKECLRMIVAFLRDPQPYLEADARVPNGILLSGPPGIGKTLLARAVAGEAGVPFFFTSGSEFVEMYVGIAAARVRDLFRIARRQQPCVIFIDEIDALGAKRTTGPGGAPEQSHGLNQLLTELDGFERRDSVVVVAATNRSDILDPALLRPGRLEYSVAMDLPDEAARREILGMYLGTQHDLPADRVAALAGEETARFSGADLEGLANTARIHAVEKGRRGRISEADLAFALDHVQRRPGRSLYRP